MNGVLQRSCLDQIFACNDYFVKNIDYLAPVGLSDHICMCIELKVNNDLNFCTQIKKNWGKVDENFVSEKSTEIDWNFSPDAVSVDTMSDELYSKLNKISDTVPITKLKTTKDGDIIKKLPWDCSPLVRTRKRKGEIWRVFKDDPSHVNFNAAFYQQKQ